MLLRGHVTAPLPLLINDAAARAEVGSQGQMLPAATASATDGAPGVFSLHYLGREGFSSARSLIPFKLIYQEQNTPHPY